MAWGLVDATGLGIFWCAGPLLVFGIMPFLDTRDRQGRGEPAGLGRQVARAGPLLPLVHLPLHPAPVRRRSSLACWLWASGELSMVEEIGLAITRRLRQRHRDQHRARARAQARERWSAGCRKIALAQTGYGHFFIEHNRGHHVRVATPRIPASSRLGESFYRFCRAPSSGSLRSAGSSRWSACARTGRGPWTIRNDILNAWAMTSCCSAALIAVFGAEIAPVPASSRRCSASRCSRSSTTSSTTGCCARSARTGRYERTRPRAQLELRQRLVERAALPPAAPLRSPRATRSAASRRCATSTRRPSCRRATRR